MKKNMENITNAMIEESLKEEMELREMWEEMLQMQMLEDMENMDMWE